MYRVQNVTCRMRWALWHYNLMEFQSKCAVPSKCILYTTHFDGICFKVQQMFFGGIEMWCLCIQYRQQLHTLKPTFWHNQGLLTPNMIQWTSFIVCISCGWLEHLDSITYVSTTSWSQMVTWNRDPNFLSIEREWKESLWGWTNIRPVLIHWL